LVSKNRPNINAIFPLNVDCNIKKLTQSAIQKELFIYNRKAIVKWFYVKRFINIKKDRIKTYPIFSKIKSNFNNIKKTPV